MLLAVKFSHSQIDGNEMRDPITSPPPVRAACPDAAGRFPPAPLGGRSGKPLFDEPRMAELFGVLDGATAGERLEHSYARRACWSEI